jgi:hypothetical protein
MLNISSSPNSCSIETDAELHVKHFVKTCSTDIMAWLIVGHKLLYLVGKAQT